MLLLDPEILLNEIYLIEIEGPVFKEIYNSNNCSIICNSKNPEMS